MPFPAFMNNPQRAARHLVASPQELHGGTLLLSVEPEGVFQLLLELAQCISVGLLSHTGIHARVLLEHDLPGPWVLSEQSTAVPDIVRRLRDCLQGQGQRLVSSASPHRQIGGLNPAPRDAADDSLVDKRATDRIERSIWHWTTGAAENSNGSC